MNKTPLTTAKRKRKAVQLMSGFFIFALFSFISTGWDLYLGYVGGSTIRGLSTPISSREFHPVEFWSFVGTKGVVGILLVALGIRKYYTILHATKHQK